MFDRPIVRTESTPLDLDDQLAPLHAMLAIVGEFTKMEGNAAAPQHAKVATGAGSLVARYATANSITRRRFDAILRETETVGTVGLRLIAGRRGRTDAATIAAARFLGNTIDSAISRLENLLPSRPI